MLIEEPTIFELSVEGRRGDSLSESAATASTKIPKNLLRKEKARLPEVAETDVARHFVRISAYNYNRDAGFYPLGSCTMKYNPKVTEKVARFGGFANSHPYQDASNVQGNLELLYNFERYLAELTGMDAVTLQPAAGAHGELAGMLMVRAYHTSKGNPRKKVLIPDSAHGTNPASTAICNYQVIELKSNAQGMLEPETVASVMDEDVAAIMITNPNTLGAFESNIKKIADIVHAKGGLVYCDGANMNAMMGITRPGDFGIDVMHLNLHKTFSTPHGGGGPGSGPVAVKKHLEPFLPVPRIRLENGKYILDESLPLSIGRMKAFHGNYSVIIKAYAYVRELGASGLKRSTELAVLNANYIRKRLDGAYHLPYNTASLHECVFSDKFQNENDVKTLDIAKRIMDYGMHPPTVYFPLIVHGAIMIEPTESESKTACDQFCDIMLKIADECKTNPDVVRNAPQTTFRKRLDEVGAVKKPKLCCPLC
jgi:glycine dehydrogenase subunit 2